MQRAGIEYGNHALMRTDGEPDVDAVKRFVGIVCQLPDSR